MTATCADRLHARPQSRYSGARRSRARGWASEWWFVAQADSGAHVWARQVLLSLPWRAQVAKPPGGGRGAWWRPKGPVAGQPPERCSSRSKSRRRAPGPRASPGPLERLPSVSEIRALTPPGVERWLLRVASMPLTRYCSLTGMSVAMLTATVPADAVLSVAAPWGDP